MNPRPMTATHRPLDIVEVERVAKSSHGVSLDKMVYKPHDRVGGQAAEPSLAPAWAKLGLDSAPGGRVRVRGCTVVQVEVEVEVEVELTVEAIY